MNDQAIIEQKYRAACKTIDDRRKYLDTTFLSSAIRYFSSHVMDDLFQTIPLDELGDRTSDLLRRQYAMSWFGKNKYSVAELIAAYSFPEEFEKALAKARKVADLVINDLDFSEYERAKILIRACRNGRGVEISALYAESLDRKTIETFTFEGKTLLEHAQAAGDLGVVRIIESKLNYVSPNTSLVALAALPQLPDLPSAEDLVQNALTTRQSSDALRIGQDLLNACTRFFEELQNRSFASERARQSFTASMEDVREKLVEAQAQLLHSNATLDETSTLTVQSATEEDPMKILDKLLRRLSKDISSLSERAVNSIEIEEVLNRAAPQVAEKLAELIAALDGGIETLSAELSEMPQEKAVRSDAFMLRDIFDSVRQNAQLTRGMVGVMSATAQERIRTTTQISLAGMQAQTALNGMFTNSALLVQQIRGTSAPQLREQAQTLLQAEMMKVRDNLAGLSGLLEHAEEETVALPAPVVPEKVFA